MQHSTAALATVAGRALGGIFWGVGKARARRRRALHPRGAVRRAVLVRSGCSTSTGVAWIDEPGRDEVLVRLSRSTGLPRPLPDVLGLALRLPRHDGGHGDLLLSTTGTGALTRYLLRPSERIGSAYTTMLPYRSPSGPLLLAALPLDEDGSRFELACASPTGAWSAFGVLEMPAPSDEGEDPPLAFDPVLNEVTGLDNYGWVAELRRYAYAGSRRARGAVAP